MLSNKDTHVPRLQQHSVLGTETASIDWKEDSYYRGERRGGREHGNTHMHPQPGMPRHLRPRYKQHRFALNIVPITDTEIAKGNAAVIRVLKNKSESRRRTKRVAVRDKDSTSACILKVRMFSEGRINSSQHFLSTQVRLSCFDLNFTVSFEMFLFPIKGFHQHTCPYTANPCFALIQLNIFRPRAAQYNHRLPHLLLVHLATVHQSV